MKREYPVTPSSYSLYEEVGQGASAIVYRALCIPFNEIVAIKILDFEHGNLETIAREAQTLQLVDHRNIVKGYCSFAHDKTMWVVMEYMCGGSCHHILKAAYPDGFSEILIATLLREALKGLGYLHYNGHMHRDVKAGNILVDSHGNVKLGDFGVSASLFDGGDRVHNRHTFVGTPCWMAPEVMSQEEYGVKADIWSFGITALELAHGHAPFSKHPPYKVLVMTLQNPPPGLDYERDKKFSKYFREMVSMCLVKEPSKRPTAEKLLKHHFFKHAKPCEPIVRTLLEGLPTLGKRMESLKIKEANLLAEQKISDEKKEEMSQNEYKRGLSEWIFDVVRLKAEASMSHDDEDSSPEKDHESSSSMHCSQDIDDDAKKVEEHSDDTSEEHKAIDSPNNDSSDLHVKSTNQTGNSEDLDILETFLEHLARHFPPRLTEDDSSDTNLDAPHVEETLSENQHGVAVTNGDNKVDGHVLQQKGRFTVMTDNEDDDSKEAHNSSPPLPRSNSCVSLGSKGRFTVTPEDVHLEQARPPCMLQRSGSEELGKCQNVEELVDKVGVM
ncbi:non-specific serine/threonine protein kinase [Ranunculus cassubicifolius]